MNFIISLIYAPFVFLAFRYFDIAVVSTILFFLSLFWFICVFKKGYKEFSYPLLYIFISLLSFFLKDFFILKIVPFLISSFISSLILISYINKNSIILSFVKKFSKTQISLKEEKYIHKSTLFWFLVSVINVIIHLYFLISSNLDYWVYYSSIFWYFLFLLAGVLQYLHKKFIFKV